MTVSLFDLRRMDFARKLPERARLMRDDMLRADAAVAAVSAATALHPFRGGTVASTLDETQPSAVHKKRAKSIATSTTFSTVSWCLLGLHT